MLMFDLLPVSAMVGFLTGLAVMHVLWQETRLGLAVALFGLGWVANEVVTAGGDLEVVVTQFQQLHAWALVHFNFCAGYALAVALHTAFEIGRRLR